MFGYNNEVDEYPHWVADIHIKNSGMYMLLVIMVDDGW